MDYTEIIFIGPEKTGTTSIYNALLKKHNQTKVPNAILERYRKA